ncbi:transposase [Pannus brasiliensis CCIBt3594]|uniref:Transposase n=1 Tax=Pannus brasiliensis CCIBt3594 TaxID=1427578 RepID=A0AAW9R1A3_9CHRO
MPGQRINSKQIQIYLKARASGHPRATAAAKGGFSVRTAERIDKGEHRPRQGQPRDWRTRADPYAEVWESEVVPMLEKEPRLSPTTIFEYLQPKYPDKYTRSQLRTLQKRVKEWKGARGPDKEVRSGESCFYEFSNLNSTCFQSFLEEFSRQFSDAVHTLQLDNAPFHTTRKLKIPENILFFFQPSYSPEVNPIERFWQFLKDALGGQGFENLQELKERVGVVLNSMSKEIVRSLTGWDYILQALSLAGL